MTDDVSEWIATRPGMWRSDRSHSTGAMTPIAQHIFTNAQPAGMRELFADWGMVADTLDVEFINGHYFTRLRPLVGADEVVRALQGASPSTSEPARLLAEIRRLAASSGATPTTLDELRSVTPLVDDYLRLSGARIIAGYDIASMTLGEAPDIVLATVLRAHATGHPSGPDADAVSELRARIPEAELGRFDQLLDEARSCMDMRDDNGPHLVEWPFGLVRLAVLEAGRRLFAAGSLAESEHALELTHQEISSSAALRPSLTCQQ